MGSYLLGAFVFTDGVNATAADHTQAMTMAFITLSMIQLFHAYNMRSQENSLFSSNPFSNKFLNISFIVGLVLVLAPCLLPFMQTFFGTTSLSVIEWVVAFGFAIAIIPIVELQKFIIRRYSKKKEKRDLEVSDKN